MSNKTLSKVADPYARALFEIARDKGQLQQFLDDMAIVVEVLSQCPDLITLFENPFYEDYIKVGVIMSLFIEEDSPPDKNSSLRHTRPLNPFVIRGISVYEDIERSYTIILFLQILMYRRRMSLILPIATRFKELCDELVGIKDAFCFSANALTSSQERELVAALINLTGYKEIRLKVYVDRTLLGGFQVVIGSNLIDVSLRGRLSSLFEKMAS
jgi:F-type H+-transporting ATPase subunit delta